MIGKPFHGCHFQAVDFGGEHKAGARRLAVDQDRACAAVAVGAAFLGAGKPQLVAQGFEQGPGRVDEEFLLNAVYGCRDLFLAHIYLKT